MIAVLYPISADGRFITFSSHADNLVSIDRNSSMDVFVYDRQTQTIKLASISGNGVQR